MNVYIIQSANNSDICIIAANNYNEAKIIFNTNFNNFSENAFNDWHCNIELIEEFKSNTNTSKIIFTTIN